MLKLSFIILFFSIEIFFCQSPHGKNFQYDCADCHIATSWKTIPENIAFNHSTTKFVLIGQHQSVSCRSCHTSLIFSKASAECSSCHKDIHSGTVGFDCGRCHNNNSWLIPNVALLHQNERFPLAGKHISANCQDCHSEFMELRFPPIGVRCFDCHSREYYSVKSPDHVSAGFSTECEDCHNASDIRWGVGSNNHDFFPLTGSHKIDNCFICHKQNQFTGLSKECYSCHHANYENTSDPNHKTAGFSIRCENCHNINGWKPAQFDHSVTKFPLTGAHQNTDCSSCHQNGYSNTPIDCYSCHKSDYDATTNPNHIAINFPTECTSCHNTSGWKPATFDHDARFFPVYSGEHQGEWNNCNDCHTTSSNYAAFSCVNCHEHEQAKMNEEHQGVQGYIYSSPECFNCHPTGSSVGSFNHSSSQFPLTGAHVNTSCSSCHKNGYAGTSMNCIDCHQTNFAATTNPNHQQLGLNTDCQSCHTTNAGWKPAQFSIHNNYYQLIGAHATISSNCNSCHNGNYINTPNTCYGCHQGDYQNTTNPNHQTLGFNTDCQTCHSQSAWKPATFDHDGQYFPIYTGEHKDKWNNCNECHTNNSSYAVFSCINCHEHEQTKMNEEHQGVQGYIYSSPECLSCHPNGTSEGSFNHSTSQFPLTGAHVNTSCSSCHKNGYAGTLMNCVDCHQDNFAGTTNPNHPKLGLSTDCQTCHTTDAGWKPAQFPVHNAFYTLTGAHQTIAGECNSCHIGNYTNTADVCSGCHQDNFAAAKNPNHQQLGLSTDCQVCHTTTAGWKPAQFPVHNNYFQLVGAHSSIASNCNNCHNGNYTTTPNTCFGCHQSDYTGTTNPAHQTSGFSTDCMTCHSETAWKPSTFNHDGQYFPIYSGEHRGEWNNCADCHTSSSNFKIFSCLNCHEHNKTKMDDEHRGESGYNYNSEACYECHPDGKGNLRTL